VLLADDVLGPVFRYLRGRRRLPEPAARRLGDLLGSGWVVADPLPNADS
jgi:hypothetical protein